MKAKKQKSGKWQCRYIDHYEIKEGKKVPVMGSVTRATKKEAETEAAKREGANERKEVTFAEALRRYIEIKAPVLSPSTLRAYKALQNNAYKDIARMTLSEVTGDALQQWVSKYSMEHSPKATRNAYGLLTATMGVFAPHISARATLPPKVRPDYYTPTEADVVTLLRHTRGREMEKAIILAAMGTLRRGEVCALTRADIVGDTVHVNKSMVELRGGGVAVKAPKTLQSMRAVTLPHEAIERLTEGLTESDRVVNMTPAALSNRFTHELKECGLPPFRFHDLRAFSASIRHDKGIPDQYVMSVGGWTSDSVLKAVYRRTMADRERAYEVQMCKIFAEFLQISDPLNPQTAKIKGFRAKRVGSNPTLSVPNGSETL